MRALAFVLFARYFSSTNGATYQLKQLTAAGAIAEGPAVDGVPGLHVGSMLAFKADCINVDLTGIEDARGLATVPDAVFALEADLQEPYDPEDPMRLYFLQHDGTKRFLFRDGRFQWIIAEHFIEHISFRDAVVFLFEARRLLAPGGTLRLSTPDLAIYAAAFFDPSQRFFKEHYATMTEGTTMEANKALFSSRRADMFNQIFYGYGHQHIYDEGELRAAAYAADWTTEQGCQMQVGSYREGVNKALAQLDDAVHRDESIYIDLFCERPALADPWSMKINH